MTNECWMNAETETCTKFGDNGETCECTQCEYDRSRIRRRLVEGTSAAIDWVEHWVDSGFWRLQRLIRKGRPDVPIKYDPPMEIELTPCFTRLEILETCNLVEDGPIIDCRMMEEAQAKQVRRFND